MLGPVSADGQDAHMLDELQQNIDSHIRIEIHINCKNLPDGVK